MTDDPVPTGGYPDRMPWNRWPLFFWSSLLFGLPLLVALGCLLMPTVFWDGYVWKYLLGPIVADGGGHSGGIEPGYNVYNTVTNGLWLLMFAMWFLALWKRLGRKVDGSLYPPLLITTIIGAVARVLEDMEMFHRPMSYLFITPVIYLLLAISIVAWMLLGILFERLLTEGHRLVAFIPVVAGLLLMNGVYVYVLLGSDQTYYLPSPLVPIAASILVLVVLFLATRKHIPLLSPGYQSVATLAGVPALVTAVWSYAMFDIDTAWKEHYISVTGKATSPNLDGGLMMISIWLLLVLVIFAVGYALKRKHSYFRTLSSPSVVLVMAAQLLDATATSFTLQMYSQYQEKHVLPRYLIERTGTPFVMFPLKLAVLLPFVYFLDRLEPDPDAPVDWAHVTKFGLIMLGLAPGLRDLLRLLMGV